MIKFAVVMVMAAACGDTYYYEVVGDDDRPDAGLIESDAQVAADAPPEVAPDAPLDAAVPPSGPELVYRGRVCLLTDPRDWDSCAVRADQLIVNVYDGGFESSGTQTTTSDDGSFELVFPANHPPSIFAYWKVSGFGVMPFRMRHDLAIELAVGHSATAMRLPVMLMNDYIQLLVSNNAWNFPMPGAAMVRYRDTVGNVPGVFSGSYYSEQARYASMSPTVWNGALTDDSGMVWYSRLEPGLEYINTSPPTGFRTRSRSSSRPGPSIFSRSTRSSVGDHHDEAVVLWAAGDRAAG